MFQRRSATYPLLASQDELALRALRVPAVLRLAGDGKAAKRDTRVDDARLENVGVCTSEHAGHHRARGRADCEDAVRVNAPVRDRVACRRRDPEGVAAAIVRERLVRGNVPAGAGVRLKR